MLSARMVKQTAREIGFHGVGITGSAPLSNLAPLLEERKRQGKEPEFVSPVIEERLMPVKFFPEAKSIIMVALNYYYPHKPETPLSGGLSRSAWGLDYHQVMKGMLDSFGVALQRREPDLRFKTFVDTGPLVERELARRAGLGWVGKNGALVTPEYGSWVFLGGMAVNRNLPEDKPLDQSCGSCRICLDTCPAGALEKAYSVNPHRCLSYVSQKKGYLTIEERKLLQNRIYGCDTCQAVCPRNQLLAKSTDIPAFKPLEHVFLPWAETVSLNNARFRSLFGKTAAAWRGKTNIKRNAVIALGNSGDVEALPILEMALQDPSPVVRGHAAWALGQLDVLSAWEVLYKAYHREPDPRVREEIAGALRKKPASD